MFVPTKIGMERARSRLNRRLDDYHYHLTSTSFQNAARSGKSWLPRCTSAELYYILDCARMISAEIDAEIVRKQKRKGSKWGQPC